MKTITFERMREIERRAVEEYNIPEDVLMEHAGRSAAEEILNNILPAEKDDKKIIVVCGSGGNGGDGLVCARYLIERGANIYCYIVKARYKPLVMKNLKRAFFSHLSVKEIENDLSDLRRSVKGAFLIIDCLLGIGARGEPEGIYKEIIELINSAETLKISVDVPSGFGSPAVVRPDFTYACGFVKEGRTKENCGKIKVLDIGLPKDLL